MTLKEIIKETVEKKLVGPYTGGPNNVSILQAFTLWRIVIAIHQIDVKAVNRRKIWATKQADLCMLQCVC